MRFVMFERPGGFRPCFGLQLDGGRVADLAHAAGACLAAGFAESAVVRVVAPRLGNLSTFIEGGRATLDAAQAIKGFLIAQGDAAAALRGADGAAVLLEAEKVRLLAPVPRPRKFIAAGKNFRDHAAEMSKDIPRPRQPVAFAQVASAIMSPDSEIHYPPETKTLDYEVEVAVVIGKAAFDVSPDTALDHVFGYTIFNDISARDVSRSEMPSGIPFFHKNLPEFAPLGPVLCTPDELDPLDEVRLTMRVNGEVRQDSVLANMLFRVPEIIAHWSQLGLEPGDILTTGTPSGVAAGRKSGQEPWWLRPGDVVEAEVAGIGVLRNRIV